MTDRSKQKFIDNLYVKRNTFNRNFDNEIITKVKSEVEKIIKKTQIDSEIELTHSNNINLLIAIILSAQCTDKAVNKFAWPTNKQISESNYINFFKTVKEAENAYKSINFYKRKSEQIFKLLQLTDLESQFEYDKMINLPGVGEKTAAVFLNIISKYAYVGVDTHVQQCINRITSLKLSRKEVERILVFTYRDDPYRMSLCNKVLVIYNRYKHYS